MQGCSLSACVLPFLKVSQLIKRIVLCDSLVKDGTGTSLVSSEAAVLGSNPASFAVKKLKGKKNVKLF